MTHDDLVKAARLRDACLELEGVVSALDRVARVFDGLDANALRIAAASASSVLARNRREAVPRKFLVIAGGMDE